MDWDKIFMDYNGDNFVTETALLKLMSGANVRDLAIHEQEKLIGLVGGQVISAEIKREYQLEKDNAFDSELCSEYPDSDSHYLTYESDFDSYMED